MAATGITAAQTAPPAGGRGGGPPPPRGGRTGPAPPGTDYAPPTPAVPRAGGALLLPGGLVPPPGAPRPNRWGDQRSRKASCRSFSTGLTRYSITVRVPVWMSTVACMPAVIGRLVSSSPR